MSEATSSRRDALATLDDHVPTSFYWKLTLLATVGGFLFGYDTANIGSILGFIPWKLGDLATGYLVAGASLGAAVGAFFAGSLTDRFGRKSLLVADAAIYAAGALLSAFAWDVGVLLFARTLIGLAVGADSAIATAYIAEYAPRNRRGALSMLQQWMITVGILVSYLIALVILKAMPGQATGLDWRLILGLGAVPAILALVLRTQMPESPRWLLRQGRVDDAKKAIGLLGHQVTDEQMQASARHIQATAGEREHEAKVRNWTPGVKRALIVVVVFFVFQQITGINVPFYYGPKILEPYFGGGNAVDAATTAVGITAVMSAVNVIATYFAFRFIDQIGRRKLALWGFAGMGAFMVVGAVGNGALAGVAKIAVVLIALDLFIASFAVGVGGTGWLIQGEVFPTAVRGRAAAIGATADWLANFALILVFPLAVSAIGLSWVMVAFAVLCLLAIAFVAAYLPETKELSVEQITEVFDKAASHGVLARPKELHGPRE
ncbi:sugar porter family MFS transporter [Actinopolymorpha sp. NPDC004070]|uniref:sugar porter family MFS transporter n=1 Tax=Actinopolymorpha sp. NPDC004070 TaxID=3154548 RepID=UPI0033A6F123